ncbi:MAG: carboxypeptidase regulatory-like domain-containing protein, partial [Lachnospiraceae bacterium]|nr:carboxypeptidase regulatory-like domain-containing protein [Lachnospiraceae bacterium]
MNMNKMLRKKLLPLLLAFSLILPPLESGPARAADSGTKTITPDAAGNGSGTMEISLKITGTIEDGGIAFDSDTFVYDGTVKKPTVTVKYTPTSGTTQTLVEDTDYTVSIKDSGENTVTEPKNAGAYTVVVAAKSGSCFTGNGEKTYTITKADSSAPAAPTRESADKNSITLTAHEGYQYSKDGSTWQDNPKFTGLSPGMEYSFYQRVKGTDNTNESPASAVAKFSTGEDTYAMTITLVIAKKERTAPDVSKLAVTNPATIKSADGKIDVGTSGLTAGDLAYSKDDGKTWTDVAFPITGLSAGSYCFKYKENDNYKESSKSESIVLEPVNVLSQVTLSGSTVYNSGEDSVLTVKTNSNVAGLSLSYKWYRDDKEISGQTGTAYTLTSADVGTIIKVVVTDNIGENSVSTAIPEKIAATAPTGYKISGIVQDSSSNGLGSAKVELKKGDYVVAETVTNANGEYSFEKIPAGQYNVVVTESGNEKVKTAIATITSSDVTIDTIKMPEKNVSSKLVVENNDDSGLAGGTVVGGLDDVAETLAANLPDGASAETKMTVESEKDLTSVADSSLTEEQKETKKEQAAVKDSLAAQSLEKVDFLDLSIIMRVKVADQATTQREITDTGLTVLEIVVPYQTSGRKNITAFRKHGTGAAAALTRIEGDRPAAGFVDGRFFVGDGFIVIYANKFSTYAIGYSTDNGSSGGSGGSGGGGGYVPYTPSKTTPTKPSAPVLEGKTDTTITVKAVSGQEYSIDGGKTWQTSGTFTGLTPETEYSIVTKITATSTANESPVSDALKVTTDKKADSSTPTPTDKPTETPGNTTKPTDTQGTTPTPGATVTPGTTTTPGATSVPADKVTKKEKAAAKLSLNAGLKVSQTGKKVTIKWGKVSKADR